MTLSVRVSTQPTLWVTVTKTQNLDNRFDYHRPDAAKVVLHESIREIFRDAAHDIDLMVPDGREKALALVSIEEAMFWANAGIARN